MHAELRARHPLAVVDPQVYRGKIRVRSEIYDAALTQEVLTLLDGVAALGCGAVQRVLLTTIGGETHRLHTHKEGMLADLQAELTYLLAGRAAERLMLTDVSAGSGGDATSDLALATHLALSIETKLGLGASVLTPAWRRRIAFAFLFPAR